MVRSQEATVYLGSYMKKLIIICLLTLPSISCSVTNNAKIQEKVDPRQSIVKLQQSLKKDITPLPEIDLSKIGHISPKGRVQDADYNQLKVVDDLIAYKKESIPYLISKLDDETEIKNHVMDYWSEVKVGDVALIILSDFFTDSSWKKATIDGVGWNEFLDCNNQDVSANQCLQNYIANHGRHSIKTRWQHIWDGNKDKIYWDEVERCFKVKEL